MGSLADGIVCHRVIITRVLGNRHCYKKKTSFSYKSGYYYSFKSPQLLRMNSIGRNYIIIMTLSSLFLENLPDDPIIYCFSRRFFALFLPVIRPIALSFSSVIPTTLRTTFGWSSYGSSSAWSGRCAALWMRTAVRKSTTTSGRWRELSPTRTPSMSTMWIPRPSRGHIGRKNCEEVGSTIPSKQTASFWSLNFFLAPFWM